MEIDGSRAQALVGRQIGEVVDGSVLGIASSTVRITGGCDKDGIPMRPDVHGSAKKYIVLSGGIGFKPKRPGERRRKLVRGKVVTDETFQINMVQVSPAEAAAAETKVAAKPEEPVATPALKPRAEKPPAKKKIKKPAGAKKKRK